MADLRNLMHETADLDFDAPDVVAITRAGDRRLRTRRLATVAAGLAAAAVVAGGVLATAGGDGDRGHLATEPPASGLPRGLTWAEGTVIHTSSGDIDTEHPVRAYVRAGEDFVFTDGKGGVFAVVDGEVDRIGSIGTKRPRLVSDPSSSVVAWLDPAGSEPVYVAHDLAAGSQDSRPARPGENEFAGLIGVDGTTVVWRDEAGENAWDTAAGTVRQIHADPPVESHLAGVGGGLFAWAGDGGLRVGPSREDTVLLRGIHGDQAEFAPGGRWVSLEADQMEVWEVGTGKRRELDVGGRDFATGYEWLDERSIAAIAIRDVEESGDPGDSPMELMVCDVLKGTCTVEAELGTMDEVLEEHALPLGVLLED